MNRHTALWAARGSFAAIAAWIALATVLAKTGPAALHALVDLPFSIVCHRMPERVIAIAGAPMPLCSRCLGMWVGLSLGAAFAWPALSLRALRIVLPIAAIVMLAEVVTQDLGLHPVYHPTRIATGLFLMAPLGGAIGAVITRELGGVSGGSS